MKKLISILNVMALLVCAAIGFTGCSNDNSDSGSGEWTLNDYLSKDSELESYKSKTVSAWYETISDKQTLLGYMSGKGVYAFFTDNTFCSIEYGTGGLIRNMVFSASCGTYEGDAAADGTVTLSITKEKDIELGNGGITEGSWEENNYSETITIADSSFTGDDECVYNKR